MLKHCGPSTDQLAEQNGSLREVDAGFQQLDVCVCFSQLAAVGPGSPSLSTPCFSAFLLPAPRQSELCPPARLTDIMLRGEAAASKLPVHVVMLRSPLKRTLA